MPQKMWTIEARVTYSDEKKYDEVTTACRALILQLYSTMALLALGDPMGSTPHITLESDNFFHGWEEIKVFAEKVNADAFDLNNVRDNAISDELLEAALRMKGPKS